MKTQIPFITIGLDLGDKKQAALCDLNQDGEIIADRTEPRTRSARLL
jgi:hypothetical protein